VNSELDLDQSAASSTVVFSASMQSAANFSLSKALAMLRLTTAIALFVYLNVWSVATAQPSPQARGEAIATKQCGRCHSVTRSGESPMGLAPPFRDLSRRYPIDNLAEALAEGIVTGHPAMPRFTFEPRDIDALLTYIESLAP
jgi:mono/diheme cytochrome c family protein